MGFFREFTNSLKFRYFTFLGDFSWNWGELHAESCVLFFVIKSNMHLKLHRTIVKNQGHKQDEISNQKQRTTRNTRCRFYIQMNFVLRLVSCTWCLLAEKCKKEGSFTADFSLNTIDVFQHGSRMKHEVNEIYNIFLPLG